MWSGWFTGLSTTSQCLPLKAMTTHVTTRGYGLGEVYVDSHRNTGREELGARSHHLDKKDHVWKVPRVYSVLGKW